MSTVPTNCFPTSQILCAGHPGIGQPVAEPTPRPTLETGQSEEEALEELRAAEVERRLDTVRMDLEYQERLTTELPDFLSRQTQMDRSRQEALEENLEAREHDERLAEMRHAAQVQRYYIIRMPGRPAELVSLTDTAAVERGLDPLTDPVSGPASLLMKGREVIERQRAVPPPPADRVLPPVDSVPPPSFAGPSTGVIVVFLLLLAWSRLG